MGGRRRNRLTVVGLVIAGSIVVATSTIVFFVGTGRLVSDGISGVFLAVLLLAGAGFAVLLHRIVSARELGDHQGEPSSQPTQPREAAKPRHVVDETR